MEKIVPNTGCILVVLLALLGSTSCEGPSEKTKAPAITAADTTFLRHLKEVEWPKAYAEQDTALLDRILGDDFQMIDQEGNWYTKADELAWIKEHATQNDSFRYEIRRFEVLPNGTAIINGTGHIYQDTVRSVYQSSNVLIKRDGIWKAVLSHVSGVRKLE